MNRFEKFLGLRGEAKVKLLDGEYQIVAPGEFVVCSVTGEQIPLDELRYWNVQRQEVYASALISLRRHQELMQQGRV